MDKNNNGEIKIIIIIIHIIVTNRKTDNLEDTRPFSQIKHIKVSKRKLY